MISCEGNKGMENRKKPTAANEQNKEGQEHGNLKSFLAA